MPMDLQILLAYIDFNCSDVIIQYNYSANNVGGFCEILGNNYNCAYRYNISVNDGHRMKGQNGAFQQGKTLWLSGFVGKGNERNGPLIVISIIILLSPLKK